MQECFLDFEPGYRAWLKNERICHGGGGGGDGEYSMQRSRLHPPYGARQCYRFSPLSSLLDPKNVDLFRTNNADGARFQFPLLLAKPLFMSNVL